MQTNLYVSAAKEDASAFNLYNKNIYRGPSPADGYMMPLFYLDESGQISPGDAAKFKSQVRSLRHCCIPALTELSASGLWHSDCRSHHRHHQCVRWRFDDDHRNRNVRDFIFALLSATCNAVRMYWFDRQSNRHRILIEDDPDFGGEAPATHASTSSLFAAISSDRKPHGSQAPPGSPRASD
jgi:hypothetical protein